MIVFSLNENNEDDCVEFDGKNLVIQEYYKYGDFCRTTFVVCEDLEKE